MSEAFSALMNRRLTELPAEQLRPYLTFLRTWLRAPQLEYIRQAHADHGADWPFKDRYHVTQGRGVREALREAGYPDAELPTGSWDDYYIQLVEIVAGLRPDPTAPAAGAHP